MAKVKIEVNQGQLSALYQQIAMKLSAALEPIAAQYKGHPVEEIRPVVDAALRQVGVTPGDISDTIAEQISRGEQVRVTLN